MSNNTVASGGQPSARAPISQQKAGYRKNLAEWIRQLPQITFPKQNHDFQLIDPVQLDNFLNQATPDAAQKIREDLAVLDRELLPLFRDRDYVASQKQNQYRLIQIAFIVLATIATLIGSFQALALNISTRNVPFWAFLETLVALIATYLATISGREPPLPEWLENRRRAESLRREYFRFLMDMPPYDAVDSYERRGLLARRAAN
ncbi:MAG TPA: DUF4231 domain-containing protein, partial [Aggregatilineales bacterium]|nr:DUF4231 domain-containing protein [Aggregatilineales bacterium]